MKPPRMTTRLGFLIPALVIVGYVAAPVRAACIATIAPDGDSSRTYAAWHSSAAPEEIVNPLDSAEQRSPATAECKTGSARVSPSYGRLPLHFEANRGQTAEPVKFLARSPGHTVFLTSTDAVVTFTSSPQNARIGRTSVTRARSAYATLRWTVVGANPATHVAGRRPLTGTANYFVGKDPARWRANVPMYAAVHYRDVYPGIDLVYYGTEDDLEYDFIVGPGADPKRIALRIHGAERLDVDGRGDLILHTAKGHIRQRKPLIYQEDNGVRREIRGGFRLTEPNQVGFHVAAYDHTRPLTIDPVLAYSTYLGGSGNDSGQAIAVDTSGSAYVTGLTASANFPTSPGALQPLHRGAFDVFVTKLNPSGTALVYSTYLGGNDDDAGFGIAVDADGNAYITGRTSSSDFPTTPGAFQPSFGGQHAASEPVRPPGIVVSAGDAFVAKLNAAGNALVYSTYLGGSGHDIGLGIAVDAAGNAYVTGETTSLNFPVSSGAFQPTYAGGPTDAFVTKLNPRGSALVYSTYLGGIDVENVGGIAVDGAGNAYVLGDGASGNFPTTPGAFQPTPAGGGALFITKLNLTGTALVYSTHLGGSSTQFSGGIAVDAVGSAYVTGHTRSMDFPTTPGAFQPAFGGTFPFGDAFVTKLNPAGSALVYSTYLGGSADDYGQAIAVDAVGHAYVAGVTLSANFPTTSATIQPAIGGQINAFVTKLNPTGTGLMYSTYFGGNDASGFGIAVGAANDAYLTGITSARDFLTTPDAPFKSLSGRSSDAFVTKITDPGP